MDEEMEEMGGTVIDIGDTVVCDLCNADYTESDVSGGALIGSYAACPECAADVIRRSEECGELDYSVCPKDVSFKEWVMRLQQREHGAD